MNQNSTMNIARAFLIYLMLSLGTLTGVKSESLFVVLAVLFTFIMSVIFFWNKFKIKDLFFVLAFLMPVFYVYLVLGIRSNDGEIFAQRIESAFITTIWLTFLLVTIIKTTSEEKFYELYIKVAIFIVVLTFFWKLYYGFWDRDARFFINGPIVFGWISGLSIIIIVIGLQNFQKNIYYIVAIVLMLASMIWSASKGPMIGLLVVYLMYALKKHSWRALVSQIFISIFFAGMLLIIPADLFTNESISRLLESFDGNSTLYSVNGSIGIRIVAWESAWHLFSENILFGVGPTNWRNHSEVGFLDYPHNIMLELLSEVGLIGFSFFLTTIIIIYLNTSATGKYIMIYIFLCMCFSGDVSYLRFLISLPLAIAIAKRN